MPATEMEKLGNGMMMQAGTQRTNEGDARQQPLMGVLHLLDTPSCSAKSPRQFFPA